MEWHGNLLFLPRKLKVGLDRLKSAVINLVSLEDLRDSEHLRKNAKMAFKLQWLGGAQP